VRLKILHVTRLPTDRDYSEGQHVRLWLAGVVTGLQDDVRGDGEVAAVEALDWEIEPSCRHCGRGL
jgi:hypothetical protein